MVDGGWMDDEYVGHVPLQLTLTKLSTVIAYQQDLGSELYLELHDS